MFALRTTALRSTVVAQRSAAFSTSTLVRSEGAPSGAQGNSFNKRERAEEERYVRDSELEKLKALRKAIEGSKRNLEQLEKDAAELEKKQPSDK